MQTSRIFRPVITDEGLLLYMDPDERVGTFSNGDFIERCNEIVEVVSGDETKRCIATAGHEDKTMWASPTAYVLHRAVDGTILQVPRT